MAARAGPLPRPRRRPARRAGALGGRGRTGVGRLLAETRERLRIGALCLGRAQCELGVELPAALVGQVLALATGP